MKTKKSLTIIVILTIVIISSLIVKANPIGTQLNQTRHYKAVYDGVTWNCSLDGVDFLPSGNHGGAVLDMSDLQLQNQNGISYFDNIIISYGDDCNPTYSCTYYQACNINNTLLCSNVTYNAGCEKPYNPSNYSDYDQSCVYVAPPIPYNASYQDTDVVPITIDFIVKLMVGLGSVAVLIGMAIVGVGIVSQIRKVK